MNKSTSCTGGPYGGASDTVTDNGEVVDLFNDTRHRGNSGILAASYLTPKL